MCAWLEHTHTCLLLLTACASRLCQCYSFPERTAKVEALLAWAGPRGGHKLHPRQSRTMVLTVLAKQTLPCQTTEMNKSRDTTFFAVAFLPAFLLQRVAPPSHALSNEIQRTWCSRPWPDPGTSPKPGSVPISMRSRAAEKQTPKPALAVGGHGVVALPLGGLAARGVQHALAQADALRRHLYQLVPAHVANRVLQREDARRCQEHLREAGG